MIHLANTRIPIRFDWCKEIVLGRIDYFVEKQLWSDVLREIYSVENPSPELKELITQIQSNDFCSEDKDKQKLSLVFGK